MVVVVVVKVLYLFPNHSKYFEVFKNDIFNCGIMLMEE